MSQRPPSLPSLELPKRWEFLEDRALENDLDPLLFVERVDDAAEHLDTLLKRIEGGDGGAIEVIYGRSGSGKTTFLKSLPKFFENIDVQLFDKKSPLDQLPVEIESGYNKNSAKLRIVVIQRRDNPKSSELKEIEDVFSDLLDLFRTPAGQVLLLWPITDQEKAQHVADLAWHIGRDSMVSTATNGKFHFEGLPKSRFQEIAENTSKNLNGDGLAAFGITDEKVSELLGSSQTISDFFSSLNQIAEEVRGKTWTVLKNRSIVHSWVLLPSDDAHATAATSTSLTQGTQSKIDVDKIGEFLDRPDNNSLYVKNWQKSRGLMAHVLRSIDARLFNLPPNVALGAIRRFGTDSLKSLLNQKSTNLEAAKDALRSTQFYKAILSTIGIETTPFAGNRPTSDETANEYLRIQTTASKDDKPLNRALGDLLSACLAEDAPTLEVVSEKKSIPNCELRPDVYIKISETEFICLEPTWRTTGRKLSGEPTQNTLTEAHMKKYALEKFYDYAQGVGLI